jgi:hypothetical protein
LNCVQKCFSCDLTTNYHLLTFRATKFRPLSLLAYFNRPPFLGFFLSAHLNQKAWPTKSDYLDIDAAQLTHIETQVTAKNLSNYHYDTSSHLHETVGRQDRYLSRILVIHALLTSSISSRMFHGRWESYKLPGPNMNIKLIFFLIFVLSPKSCGIGGIKTMMSRTMLTPPVA